MHGSRTGEWQLLTEGAVVEVRRPRGWLHAELRRKLIPAAVFGAVCGILFGVSGHIGLGIIVFGIVLGLTCVLDGRMVWDDSKTRFRFDTVRGLLLDPMGSSPVTSIQLQAVTLGGGDSGTEPGLQVEAAGRTLWKSNQIEATRAFAQELAARLGIPLEDQAAARRW